MARNLGSFTVEDDSEDEVPDRGERKSVKSKAPNLSASRSSKARGQVHAMEIEEQPSLSQGDIPKKRWISTTTIAIVGVVIAISVVIAVVLYPQQQEDERDDIAELSSSKDYVLIGNLGALQASFTLFSITQGTSWEALIKQKPEFLSVTYMSEEYDTFSKMIKEYLTTHSIPSERIVCACLVVDVAVIDGHAFIILDRDRNAGEPRTYDVDAQWMSDFLKFKVVLINDYNAFGYGVLGIEPSTLMTLQDGDHFAGAPKVIMGMGAGGGLGLAYMTSDSEGRYTSYASEGGLRVFAPRNKLELDMLKHIRKAKRGASHISVEAALNMTWMYDFFATKHADKVDKTMHEEIMAMGAEGASVISRYANQGCEICRMVIEYTFQIFGATAGDVALDFLPKGGLYVGAGTMHGTFGLIRDHFTFLLEGNNSFIEEFAKKGDQHKGWLQRIPVYLVMQPPSSGVGLDGLGALFMARRIYLQEAGD